MKKSTLRRDHLFLHIPCEGVVQVVMMDEVQEMGIVAGIDPKHIHQVPVHTFNDIHFVIELHQAGREKYRELGVTTCPVFNDRFRIRKMNII